MRIGFGTSGTAPTPPKNPSPSIYPASHSTVLFIVKLDPLPAFNKPESSSVFVAATTASPADPPAFKT